jgi:hypothetical protein
VAFEVVHGDQGELARKGQAFSAREANEEGPDQARSHCNGDAAYLVEIYSGVGQSLLHDAIETFEVGAGSHLGDDSTVAFVLSLSVDDVGESVTPAGFEYGGAGVVARGFNSEDHAAFIPHPDPPGGVELY